MSCGKACTGAVEYDFTGLDEAIEACGGAEGSLIAILQKAQGIYGYLPREAIEFIARALGIKTAKIYGVATFYTQFRFEPAGRFQILLCMGTACHVNGAKGIEDAICTELGITDGETTRDGLFTLNKVACIGCCSLSPVMMINGETYGALTGDRAKGILAMLKRQAEGGSQ